MSCLHVFFFYSTSAPLSLCWRIPSHLLDLGVIVIEEAFVLQPFLVRKRKQITKNS